MLLFVHVDQVCSCKQQQVNSDKLLSLRYGLKCPRLSLYELWTNVFHENAETRINSKTAVESEFAWVCVCRSTLLSKQ